MELGCCSDRLITDDGLSTTTLRSLLLELSLRFDMRDVSKTFVGN
jgi:hypothetical protein